MPSVLTGANLANRDLIYLGVSGDGDSASIGLGQFAHCLRRGVNMVYIVENNGVYGLTKGQFSATADRGSKAKRGAINNDNAIDLVAMAMQLGATFVARSFSGDKKQLQAILKAAITHNGLSVIDVISPCTTFNDHEGSTKSYSYVKDHEEQLNELDFVPYYEDISADIAEGEVKEVEMHDGSKLRIKKLGREYDPTSKFDALKAIDESNKNGEVLTGVYYVDTTKPNFMDMLSIDAAPLATLPESKTRPPKEALAEAMEELR
jgi:2-oxoglutarate ferredoxin oxidoreductase subunit beta